jgi:hypothetical protein
LAHREGKKLPAADGGGAVALKRRRVYRGRGQPDPGIAIKFCSQKLIVADTSDGVSSLTQM